MFVFLAFQLKNYLRSVSSDHRIFLLSRVHGSVQFVSHTLFIAHDVLLLVTRVAPTFCAAVDDGFIWRHKNRREFSSFSFTADRFRTVQSASQFDKF